MDMSNLLKETRGEYKANLTTMLPSVIEQSQTLSELIGIKKDVRYLNHRNINIVFQAKTKTIIRSIINSAQNNHQLIEIEQAVNKTGDIEIIKLFNRKRDSLKNKL